MMRSSFVIAGSLLAVGCAISSHAFLDATKIQVRSEPGHSVETGGTFPQPRAQEFPLRLRLVRIDHDEYRRLDPIKYDVTISNLATVPVTFPWSPVPIYRRDRPTSGYRHAMFELVILKPGQPEFVADFFVLYGTPTVEGSLRVIQPGKAVAVRLPGIFSGSGFQDARNPVLFPTADLRVKVGMSLFAPDDEVLRFFHEEWSANALPIRIVATGH